MATTFKIRQVFPSGQSYIFDVPLNGKVTNHFSWDETINKSAAETIKLEFNERTIQHWNLREDFRNWYYENYGTGCSCTSNYRTASFNKSCGGIASSLHLLGLASDLSIGLVAKGSAKEKAIKDECKVLMEKYHTVIELGFYKWGIHIGNGVTYSKDLYVFDER